MTSSEKILTGITAEAEEKAKAILADAEEKAQAVIGEKKAEAEETASKIAAAAEKKSVLIENGGKSAAALLKRDAALAKKRELIEKALAALCDSILLYDDEKYFGHLLALIQKNAMNRAGEVFLSAKDLSRDTAGFRAALNKLDLTLSDTPTALSGGFLLKYDDILINGELSALVHEKRDAITDAVNRALFG